MVPSRKIRRKNGTFSLQLFHRSGKHSLPPATSAPSTDAASFKHSASNAWSNNAIERNSKIGQKISFFARVKKIVLYSISVHNTKGLTSHIRLWLVIRSLVIDKLDRHSWDDSPRHGIADKHVKDVLVAERL